MVREGAVAQRGNISGMLAGNKFCHKELGRALCDGGLGVHLRGARAAAARGASA
jgi:hypothetical protein